MSDFKITYDAILANEGGYNRPAGASGETYKGIDRSYFPQWPGWQIVDAYKRQYGIPEEEFIIRNPQLDAYVLQWYDQYLMKAISGGIRSVTNQTLANMAADFIIHKLYDAIKVINAVAKKLVQPQPGSIVPSAINSVEVSDTIVTPQVIFLMNAYAPAFYTLLKQYRIAYYQNPALFGSKLKFSPVYVASFISRVNKFPQTA